MTEHDEDDAGCGCADCTAWREEDARQADRDELRRVIACQLRLPMSPVPHCAGQPLRFHDVPGLQLELYP